MSLDHLWADGIAAVLPVQRVEHEIGVIASDVYRGPDGIEPRDVGLWNEAQDTIRLRAYQAWRRQSGAEGGQYRRSGSGQQGAAFHDVSIQCRRIIIRMVC